MPLPAFQVLTLVKPFALALVAKCETIVYHNNRRIKMKFITVRDFRTSSVNIWKTLPEEQEMVITNNGKPIALLTPLSDKTMEDTLSSVRRARAINAVKLIQQQSVKNGTDKMTIEEINNEIKK
jgi:antitoxin (DNA-binding transcriptional repressor) of toxin-antitoxin stability system